MIIILKINENNIEKATTLLNENGIPCYSETVYGESWWGPQDVDDHCDNNNLPLLTAAEKDIFLRSVDGMLTDDSVEGSRFNFETALSAYLGKLTK